MVEPDLRGLFVPHVTPFTESGDLDEDSLVDLIDHLSEADLGGLVSCARIGEGPVLDWEEKRRVFDIVADEKPDDLPLVATVAPQSTDEAIRKLDELADTDVDAAMIFPPLLFAWGEVEADFRYQFFEDLDAATDVPIVLFQIPVESYWYDPETVRRISELDSVVAFKEASFNIQLFSDIVRTVHRDGGDMNILTGNDRFVAESFLMGIEGALIGVSNVATQEWADLVNTSADRQFEAALSLQEELHDLKETIFAEPIAEAPYRLKTCLMEQGVIETDVVRRPQLGVPEDERGEILRVVEQFQGVAASADD